MSVAFPPCGPTRLGLYPVVDSYDWVQRLLPLGVTTLQLRIKDKPHDFLKKEIQASIALAKHYGARLFINDYWALAIACGAYGVHLGQEDLDTADLKAIQQAGSRLGISTHGDAEFVRAQTYQPSYIACGPIFPTTSKVMACGPQGIENLKRWQEMSTCPLVAIGGINAERFQAVLETGVDGIAMISAITQSNDPLDTTRQFLKAFSLKIE